MFFFSSHYHHRHHTTIIIISDHCLSPLRIPSRRLQPFLTPQRSSSIRSLLFSPSGYLHEASLYYAQIIISQIIAFLLLRIPSRSLSLLRTDHHQSGHCLSPPQDTFTKPLFSMHRSSSVRTLPFSLQDTFTKASAFFNSAQIIISQIIAFLPLRIPSRRLQPFSTPRPIRERYFMTSPSSSPLNGATTTPTPGLRHRSSTMRTSSSPDPSPLLLHLKRSNLRRVQVTVGRVQPILCRPCRSNISRP